MRLTKGPGLSALAALVVAVVLAMLPAPAEAVTCPTNSTLDTDKDGFTDAQECAGIPLDQGTAAASFPSCFDAAGDRLLARSACLDPNSPDLFVILVPRSPSLIPSNFFEFVAKPKPEPDLGLGIAIHQLTPDQASVSATAALDRLVTSVSPQKAVRVTENTANLASGTVLGQATNGTPNTTGKVVVWPVRILEHVNAVRAAAGLVEPLLATDLVVVQYIKQVIAHEMGHVMGPLANVDKRTASANGGKHYAAADDVIMSQFVTNDGAGNFDIGPCCDDFKVGDQSFARLI